MPRSVNLRTGVHRGASGQSPQEHRCAASQHAGMLPLSGAISLGVASSPGKFIWNGEPVFGTRLSCIGNETMSHVAQHIADALWAKLLSSMSVSTAPQQAHLDESKKCKPFGEIAGATAHKCHGALAHDWVNHILQLQSGSTCQA